MSDFLVLIDSTTGRVISAGRADLIADAGQKIVSVNPSGFTAGYSRTDHIVDTDGTITLNPKTDLDIVLPDSGNWISKQDNIIGISGDIPDISGMDVEWWDNSTTTLIDKTSAVRLDDSITTGTILDQTADLLYIGAHSKFSKLIVNVAIASTGGTLVAKYWNGAWVSLSITDGTSDLSDLAADRTITFTIPLDWAAGGTYSSGSLDSSLFYISLEFSAITTGPDLDQIVPDLGNFQENGIVIDNVHEDSQGMEIVITNKTADSGLTREISTTRDGSSDDYTWVTQAQVVEYTPVNAEEQEVTHIVINGTDFNFTTPAPPNDTVEKIVDGLVAAISGGSEPVTATDETTLVKVTADTAGVPFNPMEVQFFDLYLGAPGVLVDFTDEVMLDDASVTTQLFRTAGDFLYIGQRATFSAIDFIVELNAQGAEELIVEYWNGSTWTAVSSLVDGTYGSGSTMWDDGRVSFTLPSNWSTGTHINVEGLDRSILYFVRLSTVHTTTGPAVSLNLIDIVNEFMTNPYVPSPGSIVADRTTKDINKIELKLKFETRSSIGVYDITFDPAGDFLHQVCASSILADGTEVGVLYSGAFEVKDFTKSRWLREEPANSPANGSDTTFNLVENAIRDSFKVLLSPREESNFSAEAVGVAIANEYFVGKSTDGVAQPANITYLKAYLTARTAPVGSDCDVVIENIDDTTSATVSIADGTTFKSDTISLAFDETEKLAVKFGTNVGLSSTAQDISVVLVGDINRAIGEGLVYVDPEEYTINFSSTNPDEIESVTFTTAPKNGTRVFFDFAIYNSSEAKPATMSGALLTRRVAGHC